MSEIKNFHKLLIENVNEENEKRNEEDSVFQSSSKNNLISIAKENLKSKNNLKLKIKNIQTSAKVKSPKIKLKSIKKKEKKNENVKNDFKFSDKEYLNFMLHDLKYISSSIKKKQNRFNPKNGNNNIYFKNRLSQDTRNRNKRKLNDIKKIKGANNLKTHNYNDINLLDQIIGPPEDVKPGYENKITFTDDNLNLDDLYFDKFTNQILIKNIMRNCS